MVLTMWKEKYIPWFRIIESVFGGLVPNLLDEEIMESVFDTDWMIIKKWGDRSRTEAKDRPIPNLFMSLHDNKIHLGLAYENIASIELFKNILHDVHNHERSDFISYLTNLDKHFKTKLYRRIREYYPLQQFEYELHYEFTTKEIDLEKLVTLIKKSDEIRSEGREEKQRREISWPPYTPSINLLDVYLDVDEKDFRVILNEIKPIYEIILSIKTNDEISQSIERENRKKILELRNTWYCIKCNTQYTKEDYETQLFCPICGSSRATWLTGDHYMKRMIQR